ncbi:MAG: rRNA maturation RNase YbeY [Bdellovibrionales bacterium]|nr:rRNA maturation RNase YbeY [Bdellovibrionales bacterium]
MPQQFLTQIIPEILRHLPQKNLKWVQDKELSLIFVEPKVSQKLNLNYRNKNNPTDVLSFSASGPLLGELVLCPQVIRKQAQDNLWTFRLELTYMVIHGILHLLGYEHEQGGIEAQRMLKLQDKIFYKVTNQKA